MTIWNWFNSSNTERVKEMYIQDVIDHINVVTEYQQLDVMINQIDRYHKQMAMEMYLLNKNYSNTEIQEFFYQEGEITPSQPENKQETTSTPQPTPAGNANGNDPSSANTVNNTDVTAAAKPAGGETANANPPAKVDNNNNGGQVDPNKGQQPNPESKEAPPQNANDNKDAKAGENNQQQQSFLQKLMGTIAKICDWIAKKANELATKMFAKANVDREKANEKTILVEVEKGSPAYKALLAMQSATGGGSNTTQSADASAAPQQEVQQNSYTYTFNEDDGYFYYQEDGAEDIVDMVDFAAKHGGDIAGGAMNLMSYFNGQGTVANVKEAAGSLESFCSSVLSAGAFNAAPWTIFNAVKEDGATGLLNSMNHDINDVSALSTKYKNPEWKAFMKNYNKLFKPFFDTFDANTGGQVSNEAIKKLFEMTGADITFLSLPLPPTLIAGVQNLGSVVKNPAFVILIDLIANMIKEWRNPYNMNNNPIDATYSVLVKGAESWAKLLQQNAQNIQDIVQNRQIMDDVNKTVQERVQALDKLDALFRQEGLAEFMSSMCNYGVNGVKGIQVIGKLGEAINSYMSDSGDETHKGTFGNWLFSKIKTKNGENLSNMTYDIDKVHAQNQAMADAQKMGADPSTLTDEDVNLYMKERSFFTKCFTETLQANSSALKFLDAMSRLQLDISTWTVDFFHALDDMHDYHVAEAWAAQHVAEFNGNMDDAIDAALEKQASLKEAEQTKMNAQANQQRQMTVDFSDPAAVKQARQQMAEDATSMKADQFKQKWGVDMDANSIDNFFKRQGNMANANAQQQQQQQTSPAQQTAPSPVQANPNAVPA